MANYTDTLNLIKPEPIDFVSIDDLNDNFDKIDNAFTPTIVLSVEKKVTLGNRVNTPTIQLDRELPDKFTNLIFEYRILDGNNESYYDSKIIPFNLKDEKFVIADFFQYNSAGVHLTADIDDDTLLVRCESYYWFKEVWITKIYTI